MGKWLFLLLFIPLAAFAQLSPDPQPPPSALDSFLHSPNPSEQSDYLNLHAQIRIVALLTAVSLIPFVVVMMTSFTRITIILNFLKQALATQQVPSNQLVIGLSLILTGFIMHPVIEEVNTKAFTPFLNNEFANAPEVRMGLKGEDRLLFEAAWKPMRNFMLGHTREKDLKLFLDIAHLELPRLHPIDQADRDPQGIGTGYDLEAIPWYCLVPSFVLSELRVAFMMGFLLFLPFLVIDMIVASILMSMGMMMLPPVMISMPFKLLLFILIDGWRLVIQQVVTGFYPGS